MKTGITTFEDLLNTLEQSNYKLEVATQKKDFLQVIQLKQNEIPPINNWINNVTWIMVYTGTHAIVLRNKTIKPFLKKVAELNKKHLSEAKSKNSIGVAKMPQSQRKQIISMYKQGFAGTYIAEKLNVTVVTVSKWITKYKELEKFCNDREKTILKQIDKLLASNTAKITEITDLMKGLDTLKKYHNTLKTRF